jgi:hypothetical protein
VLDEAWSVWLPIDGSTSAMVIEAVPPSPTNGCLEPVHVTATVLDPPSAIVTYLGGRPLTKQAGPPTHGRRLRDDHQPRVDGGERAIGSRGLPTHHHRRRAATEHRRRGARAGQRAVIVITVASSA